ncbi:hypothetical protein EDF24_3435 [Curtobacterium sp. PhB130]|uniref:hypothetical protein n=1 Tax=Curtobacterium sp. PhB130 TaxID=2485178 RepID=UPI000F4CC0D9|nr:hypothetical protein [Curtobacterium sp. PhB130]ROS72175.1 hypothetical protein EDF24_3435 [Curtobacterium sp. PhB130]
MTTNITKKQLIRPRWVVRSLACVGLLGISLSMIPVAPAAAITASVPAEQQIAPDRWVAVWQRWDGTNYSSQATCLSRGRTIMKHYSDVKAISCRKPCGKWWLYTYREQWV